MKKLLRRWLSRCWLHHKISFTASYKVSAEKKQAFKSECKKMIIDILVKLQKNTPLQHTII